MRFEVREYVTADGKNPFREWLNTLDMTLRARIQARLLRFELGNIGDHKAVGRGVWEARLTFGAGYRVYFGKHGRSTLVLVLGGDKRFQSRDIRRAQQMWADYIGATRHETQ